MMRMRSLRREWRGGRGGADIYLDQVTFGLGIPTTEQVSFIGLPVSTVVSSSSEINSGTLDSFLVRRRTGEDCRFTDSAGSGKV